MEFHRGAAENAEIGFLFGGEIPPNKKGSNSKKKQGP
jgi:hypothetical protein